MTSLSSAKTLGGIGGILVFFPGISLIGWILILVALNEISDVVQDRSIFDDALIAGITAIIGAVTLVVFLATGSVGVLFAFGAGALGVFAILGAFWVFAIISAIFLKRAYDKAAQRLNVGAFATAGLLYLIGALTTIVLVGFLILFIALIFQVVAYFSIQDRPPAPLYPGYQTPQQTFTPQPPPMQPPQQPQPMQQPAALMPQQPSASEFKFCFKCGARLPASAGYCTSCGARQS